MGQSTYSSGVFQAWGGDVAGRVRGLLARLADPPVVLALKVRIVQAGKLAEPSRARVLAKILLDIEAHLPPVERDPGADPGAWVPWWARPTRARVEMAMRALADTLGCQGLHGTPEELAGILTRRFDRPTVEAAVRRIDAEVPLTSMPEVLDLLPDDYLAAERAAEAAHSALWDEHIRASRTLHQSHWSERRRQVRDRLSSFARFTLDGIVAATEDGSIASANPAAERMLGRSQEELAGRPLREIFVPEDASDAEAAMLRVQRGRFVAGAPHVVELRARCSEEALPVEAAFSASAPDGGERLVVAVLRDRTERLRREEEARRSQRQLADAQRLAALGQLAATVGHEINNPATFVMGNLQLVREALDPDDGMSLTCMDEIELGMRRIRTIVRDLSQVARNSDDLREEVDVDGIVERVLRIASVHARHRATVVHERGDPPHVHADAGRLQQVVLNLVINAVQAIPEGHPDDNRVVVRTESRDRGAWLSVTDTGCGIPDDVLPRLFEPFYTTKQPGEGTGLGLPITREIVRAMGGRIQVKSKLGEGTTFEIWLPPGQPSRTHELAAADDDGDRGPVPRGRLLCVDDEVAVLDMHRRVLGNEHDVVCARSGEAALELLRGDDAFDLVLGDLHMPGMSGMELFARLEAELPALAERFVVVTAGGTSDEALEFVSRHVERAIFKPVLADELRASVERALRSTPWRP